MSEMFDKSPMSESFDVPAGLGGKNAHSPRGHFTTHKHSLGQGNVFTGVCHSFCQKGSLASQYAPHCHMIRRGGGSASIGEGLHSGEGTCIQGSASMGRGICIQVGRGVCIQGRGICMQRGLHPRGFGQTPSPRGKVCGTHPTGMLSCFSISCCFKKNWPNGRLLHCPYLGNLGSATD